MIRCLLLAVLAVPFLAACGDDEPVAVDPVAESTTPKPKALDAPPVVPNDGEAPNATPPSAAAEPGTKPVEEESAATKAEKKPVAKKAPDPAGARLTQLVGQLDDEDAGRRFSAAVELGKLGDVGCVDALVTTLKDDDDYFVRRAAARSLGMLDSERAVPALIDAVDDDEIFVGISAKAALTAITGRRFETKAEWSDWWAQQPR